jgi:uncharacterized protein YyaL (SSP411 family)
MRVACGALLVACFTMSACGKPDALAFEEQRATVPADAAPTTDTAQPSATASHSDTASQSGPAQPTGDSSTETDKTRPANRLAKETSPYLLLHAHNPVDWYAWGPEALAKARDEKKLIFLSIGYSSCFWCHVMERESFEDEEIAAYLNRHFVCIKVDREERPDIDEIYMTSLQVYLQLTDSPQGGGWPLSMFLDSDARPFLGGTYLPPRDTPQRPGLLSLLKRVVAVWEDNPQQILKQSGQLSGIVRETLRRRPSPVVAPPDIDALAELQEGLAKQYDPRYGGFGFVENDPNRPKFPEPSNLRFLLQQIPHESPDVEEPALSARAMLLGTLEHMASGGIRDHLGGGFHRYSTDRYWRIPHFEKMLYDNAQLARVYAEAHKLAPQRGFDRVVRETLDFVLSEMTDPRGGFYSALDAETDGEEGAYYVFSDEQLNDVLDVAQRSLLDACYGTGEAPNFEGRWALLLARPLDEVAARRNITPRQLRQELAPILSRLLQVRRQRERPLRDTKVLTAWNGLMIRALADTGRILEEPRYVEAARRAATFLLEELRAPKTAGDGSRPLLRSWRDGQAKLNAYLDDYAFLIDGLIALHQATGDQRYLVEADQLMQQQTDRFWDPHGKGFFFTSHDHEELIARSKDPVDSALPSGNAVSVSNLVYLAHALSKPGYLDQARATVSAFAALMEQAPTAMPQMGASLAALLEAEAALEAESETPEGEDSQDSPNVDDPADVDDSPRAPDPSSVDDSNSALESTRSEEPPNSQGAADAGVGANP